MSRPDNESQLRWFFARTALHRRPQPNCAEDRSPFFVMDDVALVCGTAPAFDVAGVFGTLHHFPGRRFTFRRAKCLVEHLPQNYFVVARERPEHIIGGSKHFGFLVLLFHFSLGKELV
jgi:hypothetical protein